MRDELLPYYERELTFIRQMAGEFQEKYPAVARGLRLEPNACQDPHVERLIEAFALLCGRVHHKLDDEFPEITESLLDVLYPHYLRPIPSMAIAQFQLDDSQSAVASATEVPVGTAVHSQSDSAGLCSFRTCYPVTLWPLRVAGASVSTVNRFATPSLAGDVAAVVRIQLECLTGRFSQLPVSSLRFYLDGESAAIHTLYEFLFLNVLRVSVRTSGGGAGSAEAVLPGSCLRQVGFAGDEGLLPYSDRSFLGYRLLQEYFVFPEKFFFFDLVGLDRMDPAGVGSAFEIVIALKQPMEQHRLVALEQAVNAKTFRLGCSPIVNLFGRTAEPIRLTQTKAEYQVVPDRHAQMGTEVYSVDRVASTAPYLEMPQTYDPFYGLRHGYQDGTQKRFWYTHRRPSFRKNDDGTEVYISLVDFDFNPALPPVEMLSVRVTCTNRNQASLLRLAGDFGELEPEGLALVRARCLRKPTPTVRPPLRRGLQWRLISHLSLNHLSIVEKGRDALQEILRLYDFTDEPAIRKQIAGIVDLRSRAGVSKVHSETGVVFCRGTDVTIEFDDDQYVGTGVFLLSSVLQKFLALYSALNSFSRLKIQTRKRGVLKQWPPMAGEQILL